MQRVAASSRRIRRLAAATRRELADTAPWLLIEELGLGIMDVAVEASDRSVLMELRELEAKFETGSKVLYETEVKLFLMLRQRIVSRKVVAAFTENRSRVEWILGEEIRAEIGVASRRKVG